jgi:hypothetical protein
MSLITFVRAFGAFEHRHGGIRSVHTILFRALSGDVGVKYVGLEMPLRLLWIRVIDQQHGMNKEVKMPSFLCLSLVFLSIFFSSEISR